MTTATAVLDAIRSYLGVTENPAHSNQTIIGEKFGWNGVPWCAETVTVCEHEAGNTDFAGSASCSVLVGRYQDGTNGRWLGNPGAAALLPGDEFFLGARGQDHTGLVESIDGDTITTVEGNWGDKVARVRRPVTAFYGFGRPNYTQPTSSEDDDLTEELKQYLDAIENRLGLRITQVEQHVESIEQKVDQPVDEIRRNIRRVGTAVNAQGIEGTA